MAWSGVAFSHSRCILAYLLLSPQSSSTRMQFESLETFVVHLTFNFGTQGTNRIHGIKLDIPETEEIQLSTDAFLEMKGLRLFICNVALSGSLKHLPNELKLLDLYGYSSPLLAPKSLPKKLVSINIFHSLIKELGNAFKVKSHKWL